MRNCKHGIDERFCSICTGAGSKSATVGPSLIQDINAGRIPDHCLVDEHSWQELCRARGQHYSSVDAEAWVGLCHRRGYLLYRRNPRGY